MNPWYVGIIELFIFAVLIIFFMVFIVMLILSKKHNKPIKMKITMLFLDAILLICATVFCISHSTYYKFNDWAILNNDIYSVIDKYGDYDEAMVQENKSGKIGYYIYTDNGPVMPDHLKYYYWIYYDENGKVYKVEESCQPGG